jgi:hypothetical protein
VLARVALVSLAVACGDRNTAPPPRNVAASTGDVVALPEEPWYRDKTEKRDDCVAPLPAIPAKHFPSPFAFCDPRAESWSSPPNSGGLHFHYRYFSVELTKARRRKAPATCCYMIWEFPRRDR